MSSSWLADRPVRKEPTICQSAGCHDEVRYSTYIKQKQVYVCEFHQHNKDRFHQEDELKARKRT